MATMHTGTVLRQIDQLFGAGTVAGLSDAQLLGRFRTQRDDVAFVALVARHGPMVLAVCRGVLRDEHAAEDAFQATFLILVRKASVLWVGESLGGWLHRVAHRVALQSHADAVRRRARERRAGEAAALRATPVGPEDELRVLIRAEIDRLPDRLRLPVVLCDLEGLTRDQAAERLCWSEGAVRGRLARARALLRQRLTRRGVMLPTTAVATSLACEASAAAIPEILLAATARAAVGQGAATAAATVLTAQVIRALFLGRLKMAAVVALTAGAIAWASALLLAPGTGPDPPAASKVKSPAAAPPPASVREGFSPKVEPGGAVEVHGRVLDPDGKPLGGVTLFAIRGEENRAISEPRATSAPDGGFRFTMRAENLDEPPSVRGIPYYCVAAFVEGFGLAWVDTEAIARGGELTLRLVRDVPIRGRILDLQGKPVVGVKVTVESIEAFPGEDLSSYLKAARQDGPYPPDALFWAGPPPGRPETLMTDAEGRFRLDGVGRERAVRFKLEGPTIRHWYVTALTRAPEAIGGLLPEKGTDGFPVHPATFDHLAEPSRLIRGIVRDRESGKPVVGAKVSSNSVGSSFARVQTDESGRYELPGHAKSSHYFVIVEPPQDRSLFCAWIEARDTLGLTPLEVNVDLARGITVRGRVTDAETGQPVRGTVEYHPLYPNPNIGRLGALVNEPCSRADIRADGTYSLAVLPGPGVLAVAAGAEDGLRTERYVPASVDRTRLKELAPLVFEHGDDSLTTAGGGDSMSGLIVIRYNDIAPINPREDAPPWTHDVVLRVGRTLEGRVVGPGGEPLNGATIIGLTSDGGQEEVLEADRFTIKALDPGQSRTLHVRHEGRGVGINTTIRGVAKGPVTIQLVRLGSATGRILDAEGEPKKNFLLRFHRAGFYRQDDPSVRTDREGRFRIDGLVPGQEYEARVDDLTKLPVYPSIEVEPGGVKDLGDSKMVGKP